MKKLIKKILRESELDWIINTQPTFGQVFKAATENDPRIVVYLSDDGEIEKIDDEAGYHYYNFDQKLYSPEDLLELAKDNITGYEDKNDNDWKHFKDVVIKTFFPDMNNLNESDNLDWIKDSNPIYDNDYYIDISDLDREEKCKLQQIILDFGFEWAGPNQYKINQQACSMYNLAYTLYPTGEKRKRIYRSHLTFEEMESPDWLVYLTHQQFLDLVGRNLND